MSPLLSAGDITSIRSALGVLLTHTYTRTPMTAGAVNDHNEATSVSGTPVTGLPCRYETVDRVVVTDAGRVTVSQPMLAVDPSDPLGVGDTVSDVTGSDGVVIVAGPFTVDRVFDDTAGLGASLQMIWALQGTDVRRAD